MSECCDPASYGRLFDSKEASRRLRKYRAKGLDKRAGAVCDYLKSRDIDGADVLEVGGGIGAFQVELLKAGAGRATNVELSRGYEDAAEELAGDQELADRIDRRIGDFVQIQDDVEVAQIVVLNRVICCYPFVDRMMQAATTKTGRFLALVYPRDRLPARTLVKIDNAVHRLRGLDFRAFVHAVDEIERLATEAGLVLRHRSNDFIWQGVVFERAA